MSELESRATLTGMLRRPRMIVGLMLTVPYALLLNSSDVYVSTTFWEDGTVRRQVQATADRYHDDPDGLGKWTADVDAGASWQEHWRQAGQTDGSVTVTRNFVVSRLPGNALQTREVFSDPLNVFSTYTFTETIAIHALSDSDAAMAGVGRKVLAYRVRMPGVVTEATATPASRGGAPAIDGSSVEFSLDASVPEHQITVVSRKVRWAFIIIVLYVLGFIVYQSAAFVKRTVNSKPRRI